LILDSFTAFGYHAKSDQINEEIIYTFSDAGIPAVPLDSNRERYPIPNNFDLVSLNHIHFFPCLPNSHHSVNLGFMGCRAALNLMVERMANPLP
jgi:hypothetical protein